MKPLLFAAAALVTLSATPAFAGAMDEVAMEKDAPVQVVSAPAPLPGAGRIVNGEIDSAQAPARLDAVRLVSRPAPYDLDHGGGR
ncbi:MAG TPA: hypothetical protein VF406_10310 [Thermodesulfobacteriota bacterium]